MSEVATLVIDQGTHASRAMLFDQSGRLFYGRFQSIALHRFPDGRAEQDPREILGSVCHVVSEVLEEAKSRRITIQQAGLATQRSTVVAWDRETGGPLCQALSWQDTRNRQQLAQLGQRAQQVHERTGLRLSPHYGASKLAWLLEHEPAVRRAAAKKTLLLGPLAAFLLYHLLAEKPAVVDVANAARTLLLNIQSCDWDQRLMTWFGISNRFLPLCRPIRYAYGLLASTEIPLTAVNGDQPAVLFAEGNPVRGSVFINLGSGAFILFPTESTLVRHRSLLSGLADYDGIDRAYYLEGAVNGAGTALSWAKEYCGAQGVAEELDSWLATEPEPPVFINTIGGLGSPWWDPELQPRFLDRTEETCRLHPIACLAGVAESILFLLRANLDEARQVGLTLHDIRASGGLARSDRLCQGLANLTGLKVLRSRQSEGTAAGMAWLASGNRASFEPLPTDSFQPKSDPRLTKRYTRFLAGIEDVRR